MAGPTLLDFLTLNFLAPKFVIRHFLKNRYMAAPTLLDFFDRDIFSTQAAPPPLFEKSVHGWSNVARFFFLLKAAPPPHFEKSVHGWYNVARFFNFIFSSPKNLLFSKMFNKIPGCKEKFRKKKIFLVCRIILSSV